MKMDRSKGTKSVKWAMGDYTHFPSTGKKSQALENGSAILNVKSHFRDN